MEAQNKTSHPFLVIMGFIFIFCFIGSAILNIVLLFVTAGSYDSTNITDSNFEVQNISGTAEQKVLLINVNGLISDSEISSALASSSVVHSKDIIERLKMASDDPNIKGIIFKINSPGGEITATDKIYNAIINFKKKTNKPVIDYLEGTAASGGYYIAVACDMIICNDICITGSIGVIMSFLQGADLIEQKLGIKPVVIKSGKHKDIGSFFRSTTEEEYNILQNIIMQMYEKFLSVVTAGRKNLAELPREELLEIADGKIYTGTQALDLGLVDQVGSFDDVVSYCKKNITSNFSIIQYNDKYSFFKNLFMTSSQKTSIDTICNHLGINTLDPGIYYLWMLN
jgi:protease-4